MPIRVFLSGLGLEHHADAFERRRLELPDLRTLGDDDLRDDFGVLDAHERTKILEGARRDAGGSAPRAPSASPYGPSVLAFGAGNPERGASADARLLGDDEVVGDFRIDAWIGRGGFGEVYRARHLTTGETLALKVAPVYEASRDRVHSLVHEWTLAKRIRHPGLLENERPQAVSARGLDLLLLPMVLAEDGSLRDFFDAHPSGRDDAEGGEEARISGGVEAVCQVADAVSALHHEGLVHLDLKPENVLRRKGLWLVADFGLARDSIAARRADGSSLPEVVGTGPYMSPEQCRAARARDVGPAADVWALGALLYEVLDGRPPFESTDPTTLREKILDPSTRPSLSGIPIEFRALVSRCLDRRSDARPTASEVAAACRQALAARPGEVRDRARRERRWLVVGSTPDADARLPSEALAKIVPHGTIEILPGEYADRLVIDKPVRIIGAADGSVVLSPPSDAHPFVRDLIDAEDELVEAMEEDEEGADSDDRFLAARAAYHELLEDAFVVVVRTDVVLENLRLELFGSFDGILIESADDEPEVEAKGLIVEAGPDRGVGLETRGPVSLVLRECSFRGGQVGLGVHTGARCVVSDCEFEGFSAAALESDADALELSETAIVRCGVGLRCTSGVVHLRNLSIARTRTYGIEIGDSVSELRMDGVRTERCLAWGVAVEYDGELLLYEGDGWTDCGSVDAPANAERRFPGDVDV